MPGDRAPTGRGSGNSGGWCPAWIRWPPCRRIIACGPATPRPSSS